MSEWGKLNCTMWSDLYTELDMELARQSRFDNHTSQQKAPTMPITELVSAKKKLHSVNYTTSGGPYGRASQQDRWTEYHRRN